MTSPAHRIAAWLDQLSSDSHERLGALARSYALRAAEGGAVVHKADGQIVPIPPILTPEVFDPARRQQLASDGHRVLTALSRLTAWLTTDDGQRAHTQLFRAFTPLERAGLVQWRHAERLATARIDFFLDTSGAARALEVNATIPAMQGYSDIIAESFLRVVGAARGHGEGTISHLVAGNGRNTDDLLASLLEHYQRFTRQDLIDHPLHIGIVARPGDAQLGELGHYARRFGELGHTATLCVPDDIRIEGPRLLVRGQPIDLLYRHVFARRLYPNAALAQALLRPDIFPIFNPISSHFEVKGMLGHLSVAATPTPEGDAFAAALGLTVEEREAIARILPWTRILEHGPSHGPAGERFADLVAAVGGEPERFVIKRSWDYGGKSVFLGPGFDEDTGRKAAEAMGREGALDWPALVRAAAEDPRDVWVVQEFVRTPERRHLLATTEGATWHDFYVDLSIYLNLGVDARPTGGVTRASASRIVNILGGGGLAPLVREEVLEALLAPPA